MNHSGWRLRRGDGTAEYENWLSGNAGQVLAGSRGRGLYESLGCVSCHGANAEGGRGRALTGVYAVRWC